MARGVLSVRIGLNASGMRSGETRFPTLAGRKTGVLWNRLGRGKGNEGGLMTKRGKFVFMLLVLALVGFGVYGWLNQPAAPAFPTGEPSAVEPAEEGPSFRHVDSGLAPKPGAAQPYRTIRGRVGMVFQNPDDQVFAATVFDDVRFGKDRVKIFRGPMTIRMTPSIPRR